MSARDIRYGRRGGNWIEPNRPVPTTGACAVCGKPMTVAQRNRHFVCSPPCDACGFPVDLIHCVQREKKP